MTHSKFAARFAVTALMLMSTGLNLIANADKAPVSTVPPAITFSVPDGLTVHKTDPVLLVTATGFEAAGLRSLSFSGGWSGSTAYYPPGYKTASTRLYFYGSYYPVGDYPFKATVTDANGVQATQTIMVHLVP